jgi:hypothetical protein
MTQSWNSHFADLSTISSDDCITALPITFQEGKEGDYTHISHLVSHANITIKSTLVLSINNGLQDSGNYLVVVTQSAIHLTFPSQ